MSDLKRLWQRTLWVIAGVAVMALPKAAWAEELGQPPELTRSPWGVELGLGTQLLWVPDDRFELVSGSELSPELATHAAVVLWSRGTSEVLSSAGYQWTRSGGQARGTSTEISSHSFLVGGKLREQVLSWLSPYGRVQLGASYFISRLGEGEDSEVPRFWELEFTGSLAAGVEGQLVKSTRWGSSVQLYLELGATLTTPLSLVYEAGPTGPERSQDIDLGTLWRAGPQLGVGVSASF